MKIIDLYRGNPECICCPLLRICTETEPGEVVAITKDLVRQSICDGSFIDAFEV